MLAPDGYTLGKCLHSSPRSEVYAAVRDADGESVALKAYLGPEADALGRHERDMLRSVQPGGFARVLDLHASSQTCILVLERIRGISLEAWAGSQPLAPPALLEVGMQLADVLSRVHTARLVHRDVQPASILVEPNTLRTSLVSFGLTQPLGAAAPSNNVSSFAGLPRYIAPEQTGRMGRGVDTRSDLYALGASLYFALIGQPPFEGDDALALIHAHMARRPENPLTLRPDLPPTLSRIVLKLLQKEPEDRYQTASALHRDLSECREQLARTGRIEDDFPLGAADAPFRPLFSKRLQGRDAESAALREAYSRASQGRLELVVLSGAPGAGKSALVHELRPVLPDTGGYLASGKFDLYRRDVPYSGVVAALESLVDQILAESEARVRMWRESLRTGLGNLAPTLVELLPSLRPIVGETPPAARLGPKETQARLALAVQRFVQSCAQKQHPLVLFLDDLQWADPGSRALLDALLASQDAALLLIAAYRDSEVDAAHPLHALLERIATESWVRLTRIALTPLSPAATAQMLAETLSRSLAEVDGLAQQVMLKTGSNPLLIQQFVLHMHGLGLIRYEHPRGWTWEESAIAAADIPDGAVALMVAKLGRLDPERRKLIEFASCVADEFPAELLVELSDEPQAELEAGLCALTEEGLLAPSARGFRFTHDRIREAAHALLAPEQRRGLHHRMGRLLLERTPPDALGERAFEIADHLNRAAHDLSDAERPQAIAVNLAAGRRALAAGSAATALSYLSCGRELFRDPDWERDAALAFSLFWESADSAYLTRDFPLALQLLRTLEAKGVDPNRSTQIEAAVIRALVQVAPQEALVRTLAGLRALGVRWPLEPSRLRVRLAILSADWRLRGNLEARKFPPTPARPASRLTASIGLIAAGGAAMWWSSQGLLCLATAHIVELFSRQIAWGSSGFALAAYATQRVRCLRDLSQNARYARAAEIWLQAQPQPRGNFHVWANLRGWLEPRINTVEALWATAESLGEVGEIEYRTYAVLECFAYLLSSGEPLSRVNERLTSVRERDGQRLFPVLESYLQVCGALQRVSDQPIDAEREIWSVDYALMDHSAIRDLLRFHWTAALCLLGDHAQAARQAETAARAIVWTVTPVGYLADYFMFRGVSHAVLAGSASGAERRRILRILRDCRKQLRRWSRHAPDIVHMEQLLAAETTRLRGHTAAALGVYQRAAQRARERGFRHHAALAHERRAELLQRLRRFTEASQVLGQAIDLYREWGAHAVVRRLEPLRDREAQAGGVRTP